MSDDKQDSELQSWVDPELEARVVAWVLGEASEFEAAELARVIEERPELGIFKKRIEAVHGLVGAAMRMELDPMRMAKERRQKLLEKLGGTREPAAETVVVMPPRATGGVSISWKWVAGIAACFVLFALITAIQPAKNASSVAAMRQLQIQEKERVQHAQQPQEQTVPSQTPSEGGDRLAALDALKAQAGEVSNLSKDDEQLVMGLMVQHHANGRLISGHASLEDLQARLYYGPDTAGGAKARSANGSDLEAGSEGAPTEKFAARFNLGRNITVAKEPMRSRRDLEEFDYNPNAGELAARDSTSFQIDSAPDLTAAPAMSDAAMPAPSSTSASQVTALARPTSYLGATVAAAGGMALHSRPEKMASGDIGQMDGKSDQDQLQARMPMTADASAPSGSAETKDVEAGGVAASRRPITSDGGMDAAPSASGQAITAPAAAPAGVTAGIDDRLGEAERLESSGQHDKAYKAYGKILSQDPYNVAARKGQEEVNRERDQYAEQAYNETRSELNGNLDLGFEASAHKFGVNRMPGFGGTPAKEVQADPVKEKLNTIVIPKINFRDATVDEAVAFLNEKSKELDTKESDPEQRGVKITVAPSAEVQSAQATLNSPAIPTAAPAAPLVPDDSRITLSLSDIPVGQALKYIAQLANRKLETDENGVRLVAPSVNTEELITRTYRVPAGFLHSHGGFTKVDDDWRPAPDEPAISAANYLISLGVQFPPGASAVYFPRSGRLIVHDTAANLDRLIGNEAPKATPTPVPQAEVNAADQPYSTFSLHVGDVSFLLAKAALDRGEMPDPGSIREEEFYNAFEYGDPAPAAGEKVACNIEQAAHPLLQQRNLVRIAMRVASTGRGAGQPLQLTVLLDTSGSMKRADRAASVQKAMEVLASLLGPNDAVTLIGFARQPRLLAEEVPGNEAGKLVEIVKRTPPDGGTNMEEALRTAVELALRHLKADAQNRVVLLTDGAANLGDADPEKLARLVDGLRQKGVSFDACGVGAEGLNDNVLEALTRKGGGRYYFLNRPEDADAGFARELAGAFRPGAENVKMQVRFNPSRVGNYQLIGFEKHRLNTEDFRNDKVTAAQLAAEEAAVALYQVQVKPEGDGAIGEVFVRYHDPADGRMVENSWTIPYDAQAPVLEKAAPSMQLAATAALLAEKLRGGAEGDQVDLNALEPVVSRLRGEYAQQARVQDLVGMFEKTRELTGEK